MIDCKEYTNLKKQELKKYIEEQKLRPGLAVIQIGDRPESNSYVRGKMRDCEEVGIEVYHFKIKETVDQKLLEEFIDCFNSWSDCHGIILQLPVPSHIDVKRIQQLIDPKKDVDGFNPTSQFEPCTPLGVINYLKHLEYKFEGKNALVIGRSDIVGKPLARMLTDLDCTVTLAHSKTVDMFGHASMSDITFTCIDKIEHYEYCNICFAGDIIDIGLGAGSDGKLHGNLSKDCVDKLKQRHPDRICISGIGGVGLLTRLSLLENVVKAAKLQRSSMEAQDDSMD